MPRTCGEAHLIQVLGEAGIDNFGSGLVAGGSGGARTIIDTKSKAVINAVISVKKRTYHQGSA